MVLCRIYTELVHTYVTCCEEDAINGNGLYSIWGCKCRPLVAQILYHLGFQTLLKGLPCLPQIHEYIILPYYRDIDQSLEHEKRYYIYMYVYIIDKI